MNNKLLEELKTEVKKLELKKGEVVIIREDRVIHEQPTKKAIDALVKIIPSNEIIVINKNTTIESLPEEEMNELGWYKKDKNSDSVLYAICVSDVQLVAEDTIGRYLTPKEIAKIKRSIGKYFPDWHENISGAIMDLIEKQN